MKNLLHNIQICAMLVLTMIGIPACSDDTPEQDHAEVSFTATLPMDVLSRSFGEAEQINTLVVGVFDSERHELYRKSLPMTGIGVDVSFALAQNQTYHFVFWAYDSNLNVYNIDDLTAISMNDLPTLITFSAAEASDAFFATKVNVNVMGDRQYRIELVRPLAQINVGTSGKVMQASFTAKSVSDTFHPFTNTVSGESDFTWNFCDTTTETFSAGGKDYNYLAMGYVFAPTVATSIAVELTLTDGDTQVSETVEFPQVEIEANCRSNIAGKFTPKTNIN